MRRIMTGLGAALLLAAAPAMAGDTGEASAALPGWMAGCWVADHGEGRQSEECWSAPRGDMMLGSGHMVAGDRSLSFEHMRIVREGDALIFIAQPGGAPPTRFTLEREGETTLPRASFVNAANDYPQRVTYWLVDGHLEAEIAMLDGSQPTRWTFRRASTDRD